MICVSRGYLRNERKLVDGVLSGKQGLAVVQLPHNAADGPNVGRLPVAVGQQQFGRAVPAGRHVVCEGLIIRRQLTCESEVTQLQKVLAEFSATSTC
jgi:hypothetical protein